MRALLEAVTWPAGSQEVVFGSNGRVKIYAGSPTEEQIPQSFPSALIGINTGPSDDDQHDLLDQQFTITTAVLVAGDPMGEFAVAGGGTADIGSSAGKGVLEVAERVRFALKDVVSVVGTKISLKLSSTETPVNLVEKHLVTNDTVVRMWCTSDLYYAPPQEIAYAGGTWTWTGENHCRGRHDFVSYALAYLVGATPSSDWSDYTQVGVSVGTETIDHAQIAGRVYCVFAEYNRHGKSGETAIAGRSRGDRVGAYIVT
jgi:hypothetical protein